MMEAAATIPLDHPRGGFQEIEGLAPDSYWWRGEHIICVPFVAGPPRPFLRFLKQIEAEGKIVFFPCVVNARLDRLLRLRGYVDAITAEPDPQFKQHIEGLAKLP